MALSEMLMSGLELMVLGMGMVFVFLTLLIMVMRGMSALAARLGGETDSPEAALPVVTAGGADPRLIAAISAAVTRYRSTRGA